MCCTVCAPLQFEQSHGKGRESTKPWIAYCAFHLGDHQKALDIYKELLERDDVDPTYHSYCACCYFYMGTYQVSLPLPERARERTSARERAREG